MIGKAKKIKKKNLLKSNKEPVSIPLNEPSIEANVLQTEIFPDPKVPDALKKSMSLDQIPISPINPRKSSKGSTKQSVIPSDNILMGGNIVTKKFKKTRKQFDVKFQTFNS